MKKLIYIFLLFGFISNAQVNVWEYDTANGGNNNGVIETSELQTALDNETNLIVNPATTITVTSQVRIDQNLTQVIDFNGSTITRTSIIFYPLLIDKSGFANTNTSISNLNLDGNEIAGSLLYIESRTQLTNVDIFDAINNTNTGGTRGIYISIKNEAGVEGEWVFDNVNIDWIASNATKTGGVTTGGSGYATGFEMFWPVVVTNGVDFVYKNSTLSNTYGFEGDLMILNSQNNDISFTNNSLWFENMTFKDFQRRAVKAFIGNTTWVNSNFYAASYNNSAIDKSAASAGMFRLGAGSSSLGSENNLICGVNFYGNSITPLNSWDNNIILGGSTGKTSAEFRNITFNGDNPNRSGFGSLPYTGVTTYYEINNLSFCNTNFGAASTVARGSKLVAASNTVFLNPVRFDSNNVYAIGETAALSGIGASNYAVSDLSSECTACPSRITTPATGINDMFFTSTGNNQIFIDENVVTPSFPLSITTPETGETYTYSLVQGLDSALFSISGSSLVSSITFDFETPQDTNVNNIYGLNILVTSSSGATFTRNFGIYVNDLVDASEVYVTDVDFDVINQTIYVGETVNKSVTLNGGITTPDNPRVYYYSDPEKPNALDDDGLGLSVSTSTFFAIAEDVTNGVIKDSINVTVIARPNEGKGMKKRNLFKVIN